MSESEGEEKSDKKTDIADSDNIIVNKEEEDNKDTSETGNARTESGNLEDNCDTSEKQDVDSSVDEELCNQDKQYYSNTGNISREKDAVDHPVPVGVDALHIKVQEEQPNSAIDATARIFRNSFFEVVEELKLRRTLHKENEEQITSLLTEKNEIHRQWEEEVSRNSALKSMYEKREVDVVKQFEEKMRQYETNKAKYDLSEKCSGKEMNQLKDEIRALHLAKYSIEKRANELDRELQLQATARENHVKQLAEIEKSYREAVKQGNEVFDMLDQVERNVTAAGRLHRKLAYNNEHQNCQLASYKENLEAKQKELAHIKVVIENQKALLSTYENSSRSNENDEKELRMVTELSRQSQSLLIEARNENKNILETLKEAQTLVERHVDTVRKHSEMEAMAEFELDDAKLEYQDLRNELQEERKSKMVLQEEMEEKTKIWYCEKDEKQNKLAEVKMQLEALTLTHNSLEETNGKLSEQKEQLIREIDVLHDKVEKDAAIFKEFREKLEKHIEDKDNEMTSLTSQMTEAQNQVSVQSNSVQQWKYKSVEMEEKAETLTKTLHEVQKHNSDLNETREQMAKTIESNENEIKTLRAQLADEKREVVSQSNAALQWKEKSREMEEQVDKLSAALNEKQEVINSTTNSSTQTNDQLLTQVIQQHTPKVLVNENAADTSDVLNFHIDAQQSTTAQNEQERNPSSSINGVLTPENTNLNQTMKNDGTACRECDVSTNDSTNQIPSRVSISCLDIAKNENLKEEAPNTQELHVDHQLVCAEQRTSSEPSTAPPTQSYLITNDNQMKDKEARDPTNLLPSTSHNNKPVLKSCFSKNPNAREPNGPAKKKVRFNVSVNDLPTDTSSDQRAPEYDGEAYIQDQGEEGVEYQEQRCTGVILVDADQQMSSDTAAKTESENACSITSDQDIVDSNNELCREENESENLQTETSSGCQELFSDDDDESTVVKCHEVGRQINQIQNFLNNERLRTTKKRKFPA